MLFNLHIYMYCRVVATRYEEHRPTSSLTC